MGNDEDNAYEEIQDSATNIDNFELVLPEEETSKEREWLKDFIFEYDENNKIFISLYQDERKWYLSGGGIYEKENLSLLQYERDMGFCTWIDMLGKEGYNIDLLFTVGEEEYYLIYSDGELISDTVPLDSWDYSTFLTSDHTDKLNAYREFDDFIHNE